MQNVHIKSYKPLKKIVYRILRKWEKASDEACPNRQTEKYQAEFVANASQLNQIDPSE